MCFVVCVFAYVHACDTCVRACICVNIVVCVCQHALECVYIECVCSTQYLLYVCTVLISVYLTPHTLLSGAECPAEHHTASTGVGRYTGYGEVGGHCDAGSH